MVGSRPGNRPDNIRFGGTLAVILASSSGDRFPVSIGGLSRMYAAPSTSSKL